MSVKYVVSGRGMATLLVLMLLKEVSEWVRGDPEGQYAVVKVVLRGWSWRVGNKGGRSESCWSTVERKVWRRT